MNSTLNTRAVDGRITNTIKPAIAISASEKISRRIRQRTMRIAVGSRSVSIARRDFGGLELLDGLGVGTDRVHERPRTCVATNIVAARRARPIPEH
ncbi:MAG TPA: hypothetical protein VHV78_01290 [Gemmatimonadaceae bacterium]|nr:hypothetical protein [Gemmatimonadaceae bacterium]